MKSLGRFNNPPSRCEYLKDRLWNIELEQFAELSVEEYRDKLRSGWRRFGNLLLIPNCAGCRECKSLRILADRFQPSRSQRRVARRNSAEITLQICAPTLTHEIFELYLRYHGDRVSRKNWSSQSYSGDPVEYYLRFVLNPFASEEWRYFYNGKLAGVGYVDRFSDGLSAIYFFSDPELHAKSLGTFNVLSLLEDARRNSLPHVYLGYYVAGSDSMEYKSKFVPNEYFSDGAWTSFKS